MREGLDFVLIIAVFAMVSAVNCMSGSFLKGDLGHYAIKTIEAEDVVTQVRCPLPVVDKSLLQK